MVIGQTLSTPYGVVPGKATMLMPSRRLYVCCRRKSDGWNVLTRCGTESQKHIHTINVKEDDNKDTSIKGNCAAGEKEALSIQRICYME